MPAAEYPHIVVSPDGVPFIDGTQTKVVEVVLDQMVHHWDAEEIQRQHPHLHLAQIYSALAYYHDHEVEMNGAIEERLRREEDLLARLGDSRIRAKLLSARRAC